MLASCVLPGTAPSYRRAVSAGGVGASGAREHVPLRRGHSGTLPWKPGTPATFRATPRTWPHAPALELHGPIGMGAAGGLAPSGPRPCRSMWWCNRAPPQSIVRARTGAASASDGQEGRETGEGSEEQGEGNSPHGRILLVLALGAVAGAVLPLPGWAKALPELLLGLVFRAQIWRLLAPYRARVTAACQRALAKFNANRRAALIIPFVAAFVGWLTNWLAVQMIFYPIGYWGLPIKRWILGAIYECPILQPLGLLGWQGIVPAKAAQMAYNMVEMVTTQLISVQEVFSRLDPGVIATLLRPEVPLLGLQASVGMVPDMFLGIAEDRVPVMSASLQKFALSVQDEYVRGLVEALQRNVDACVDLKELVVKNMCEDKDIIVRLFQQCGREELRFLVESGLYFGFLLGILQMIVWLFYDSPWTLTVGGATVGYITNWLALKCIFEPLHPVQWGPFVFHGIFLKRQYEVSCEFARFLASEVLTSAKMWATMLFGARSAEVQQLVRDHTTEFVERFQPGAAMDGADPLISEAADRALAQLPEHIEPLHDYIDNTLQLQAEMESKLKLMSPEQFERVLHPIFEEDELTLILAGGVLGAIAGYVQQKMAEEDLKKEEEKKKAAEALSDSAADASAAAVTADGSSSSRQVEASESATAQLNPDLKANDLQQQPPKLNSNEIGDGKDIAGSNGRDAVPKAPIAPPSNLSTSLASKGSESLRLDNDNAQISTKPAEESATRADGTLDPSSSDFSCSDDRTLTTPMIASDETDNPASDPVRETAISKAEEFKRFKASDEGELQQSVIGNDIKINRDESNGAPTPQATMDKGISSEKITEDQRRYMALILLAAIPVAVICSSLVL